MAAELKHLREMDARYMRGLPAPNSREAIEWLRETLDNYQKADPRPDVDLGSVEGRLAALEGAPPPADHSGRLTSIEERLTEIEVRLTALEAQEPAAAPAQMALTEDELQPDFWPTIAVARQALRIHASRLHHAQTASRKRHLHRVLELTEKLQAGEVSPSDRIELQQHSLAANRLDDIDADHARRLDEIEGIDDLEHARSYFKKTIGAT